MNGNSLKLNKLCLTYETTVNEFSNTAEKSHIGTVRMYMSSVALSATSGKVEMHTLRTLVDVSLYQTVHLLSACLIDKKCMFFVICLSTILLSS